MPPSPPSPLTLALTLLCISAAHSVRFQDVTASAGLSQPNGPALKYGGAMLSDLNGDGWIDLLLLHHNSAPAEIYLHTGGNTTNLSYTRLSWGQGGDVHGATAFRYSSYRRGLTLIINRGGANGLNLQPAHVFHMGTGKKKNVLRRAWPALPPAAGARGRGAIALSLRSKRNIQFPRPDLLLTSAHMLDDSDAQRIVELRQGGKLYLRPGGVSGGQFMKQRNSWANVIDVDGDGKVELIMYHVLKLYQVTNDFELKDITESVLPPLRAYAAYEGRRNEPNRRRQWQGVSGVAELDYDNDGQWDLYIARTTLQNLHWLPGDMATDDVLLRNVGGRFVDVSLSAGITPGMDGYSRGVTVGDFDNDGFVDIIVSRYEGQDLLLRNKGDGTFEPPVGAGFARRSGERGDMVTAADLDGDGRVDVVVSEGAWHDNDKDGSGGMSSWGDGIKRGRYRILRNVTPWGDMGNYVLIRVGNAPSTEVTGLHAVVRIGFEGEVEGDGEGMMRRVGNPGTSASVSFIETVHFGVGARRAVQWMTVRWSNGERETRRNLAVNTKYTVGHFI